MQASRQFAVLCSFHLLFIDFNKNKEKHQLRQLVFCMDIVKHVLHSETCVSSSIKKLYSGAFTGRQYVWDVMFGQVTSDQGCWLWQPSRHSNNDRQSPDSLHPSARTLCSFCMFLSLFCSPIFLLLLKQGILDLLISVCSPIHQPTEWKL